MLIVRNYLASKYLKIYSLVFVTLATLLWLTQIVSIIEFLAFKGLGFLRFIAFSLLLIPEVVTLILPFVGVISSIVLALELVAKREVFVLRAAGLSNLKLCLPIEKIAGFILLFSLVMQFYILPKSYTKYETARENIRNSDFSFSLRENSIMNLSDELVVYNNEDAEGNKNLVIYRADQENEQIIFSENGRVFKFNEEILFNLTKGGTYHLKKGEKDFSVMGFNKLVSAFKTEQNIKPSFSQKDRLKGLTIFSFFKDKTYKEFSFLQLSAELFHRLSWSFLGFLLPIIVFNISLSGQFNRIYGIRKQISINVMLAISVIALHFVLRHNFMKISYIALPVFLFAALLIFLWKIDIENNFIFSKRQRNQSK